MTSPITTNSLNTNASQVASPAPESIWTKEINPGVPQGYVESNDSFNNSSQDPAAMNLNPEVKQYAQNSANKMKNILIAAAAAIVTGILFIKRKSIPVLKDWSSKIEKQMQEKQYFESMKKFFQNNSLGKILQNKKSVTTLDELKEYAKYAIKTPDATIRRIKIHSQTLEENQSMADVIKNVRLIAEDFVTTSKNKGKRPVVHIILNPEYKNKTGEIIEQLNSKSELKILNDNGKKIPLEKIIQKVEMTTEPAGKIYEKLIGDHSALINVGPPRNIDTKESLWNLIVSFFTRPTPNKIPN